MDKINVLTSKNIIVFIIISALIALSLFALDILLILFASFVITCAIDPMITKMEKKMPRSLGVTIILLGMILASVLVLIPLISVSINEVSDLLNTFPAVFDNIDKFLEIKIFNKSISSLVTLESFKDPLMTGARSIIENSILATKQLANVFTTIFAMAIVIFYLASDKERLINKFAEFFPNDQKEKAKRILDNISNKVGNYIFAQALAMIFVGLLTMIGLLIIGNNHAFFLGVITCILDIVPLIGPVIAIVVGGITAIGSGFMNVVLTILIFVLAQWAQNQLLKPVLFGKMLNMHPLMIIVALLVCARFLGFWGLILSPAIASVICVLVDELYLNRINEKEITLIAQDE